MFIWKVEQKCITVSKIWLVIHFYYAQSCCDALAGKKTTLGQCQFIWTNSLIFLSLSSKFCQLQSPVQMHCGMFGWKRSSCSHVVFSPCLPQPPLPPTDCVSLFLHFAKLTRLLGSPETQHLTDLPTVSPSQIIPSLSALITLLSVCLPYLYIFTPLHLTSFLLLFPLPIFHLTLPFFPPFRTIHCHFELSSLTIFLSFLLL